MVAEGNDDEIEDVVIPTIPDAVGPLVSQGLSNVGLIPPVALISSTTDTAREQVDDFPTSTTASAREQDDQLQNVADHSSISTNCDILAINADMQVFVDARVERARQLAQLEFMYMSSKAQSTQSPFPVADLVIRQPTLKVVETVSEPLKPTESVVVETRRPDKQLRMITPEHCIRSITQNQIRNQDNKRQLLREIHMHLQSTGLLTMLLGQRKQPPINDKNNPSGFVVGHSVFMEYVDSVDDTDSTTSSTKADHVHEILMYHGLQPRIVFVNDDNLDLFQHDSGRLMVLVRKMFHPEYDAFGEEHFRSQDPVAYYNALYKHVFSKKSKELSHQKQLLQNFRPDSKVKFLTDYRRWRSIFDEIRAITETPTSDADLQHFIDTHYLRDPRHHIVTAIHHARNEDWDFDTTLQKICDADDRAPVQTTRQQVYSLSQNPSHNKKSSQPCYSYQKGECVRGNNCRYSHDIVSENTSAQRSKQRNNTPKPVTRDDRQDTADYKTEPGWNDAIGPPRGRRTDTNSHGFSKTQIGQLNYIKSNAPSQSAASASATSSSPTIRQPTSSDARNFSSWKNESQPGYKRNSLGSLRIHTKRKHITHDDATISSQEEHSDNDDITVSSNIVQPVSSTIAQPVQQESQLVQHSPPILESSESQPTAFIKSDDGSFFEFNHAHISQRLKSHASTIKGFPLNNHIISALHHAAMYYNITNTGAFVKSYDRSDRNISIHPFNLLYYLPVQPTDNPEHHMGCCLFGFCDGIDINSNSLEHFPNHIRSDVLLNRDCFKELTMEMAALLTGGIFNKRYGIDFHSHNFSIQRNCYIKSTKQGHYYSNMNSLNDYIFVLDAIYAMDYSHNDYTNHIFTDTLLIALAWDFQVWVSQILSSIHFSVKGVSYMRWLLLRDLSMKRNDQLERSQFRKVMTFFILNTTPFHDPSSLSYSVNTYTTEYENRFPQGSLVLEYKDQDSLRRSTNIIQHYCYRLQSFNLNKVHQSSQRFLIDSGASLSATSNKNILKNITQCDDIVAYPAFGPQIHPKFRGEYGQFGIDTIIIDDMPDTLISVSQLCEGGKTENQNVAVFTSEGVRVFKFYSVRKALKLMDATGIEVLRGFTEDGVYVTQFQPTNQHSHRLFLAKFRPKSLYDHIHNVTGHTGERGMKWHRENSLNGKYTDDDVEKHRGVCQGCVYGSLHQTPTDPYRDHRPIPVIPGQCFALDAYSNSVTSTRGHNYCDIFIDLATRRHYPVFTKDRSAQELCEKTRQLFIKHPEWKHNASRSQIRFIRLDSESSYKSIEFLTFADSIGYNLEYTPVRDKHAGGIAERAVGLISSKTNVAMMAPTPHVPQPFWDYAMQYACDTNSYNFSTAIGTSPYMKITGQPVNLKYLQPFWTSCYVFIPLKERIKVGAPRAYKAHFVGYANTSLMYPNYIVIPVSKHNQYMKHKESKDVIFDPTINFSVYTEDEEPYDREFVNTDHYIPFLDRVNAPVPLQGPHATPDLPDESDVHTPILPERYIYTGLENQNTTLPSHLDDTTQDNINTYNEPYDDENGSPMYWYQFHVRNNEYPLIMCETQHFYKLKAVYDPNVPQNYYKAMRKPEWAAAIDKELTKFEKNLCLQIVPYNGQHQVPMMWLFNIKTDGTKKARLVGRGDLMIPDIDFDPNAVYCGNVTACSIKICITIAAKYKLDMKGGDLEGAYLVTRANPDYPVYIKTPQGYNVPKGMCIQAIGNLYGFPPAGQNFSIEFDKCVIECGYKNTPWDLKFFYKWKNDKPLLLIVHSDDFRWFGDKEQMNEWKLLVDTFEQHKYKVSDVTDSEFVGIRITRDEQYNYYMDQTRMVEEIVKEAQLSQAKDKKLPYPLQGPPLSKLDNATEKNYAECQKFPYRRIVGQLMYGMVHTLVTIAYALNVLSRYGNNPGPRHIEFLVHLVKYVRSTKNDRLKFETHDGPMDINTMTSLLQLRFQCDADLAGNPDTLHSQTSYLGYLGTSLICWCSTDQGSIATSTAESEIKAVNHTLKAEVISNRGILEQMGWIQQPTIIEEDNKACVDSSLVSHMTRGLRHLAITENFLKEKSADGTCKIVKIDSKNNNSDIGTKRLDFPLFNHLTFPLTDRTLRPKVQGERTEKQNA